MIRVYILHLVLFLLLLRTRGDLNRLLRPTKSYANNAISKDDLKRMNEEKVGMVIDIVVPKMMHNDLWVCGRRSFLLTTPRHQHTSGAMRSVRLQHGGEACRRAVGTVFRRAC